MEIEIPITPMLDMAFQLLTFFILTYRPSPTEGQFSMNLLPAQPMAEITKEQPKDAAPSVDALLRTLKTTLRANDNGGIAEILVGEKPVEGMDQLKAELESFVNDPVLQFDQAVIRVDPKLKYSELMKVVDVFSSLKPKPLTKLSFAELSPNEGGGPSL